MERQRRGNAALAAFVVVLSGALGAGGEEVKLTYKHETGSRSTGTGRITVRGRSAPNAKLAGEPKYISSAPAYFEFKLGPSSVTYAAVLDESKGAGTGYDLLYIDTNHNRDLSDENPVRGTVRRSGSRGHGYFRSGSVLIDYDGKDLPWGFYARYYTYSRRYSRTPDDALSRLSLGLSAAGRCEGVVPVGERRLLCGIVDADSNGRFDDLFKIRGTYSGGRIYARGDRVLIDLNGDGRFDSRSAEGAEAMGLGTNLLVGGQYYEIKIDPSGRTLHVSPSTATVGSIARDDGGAFALQLLSQTKGLLALRSTGDPLPVPVGSYQLYQCAVEKKDAAGAVWKAIGAGTKDAEQIHVTEGQTVSLKLGPPLKMGVSVRASSSSRRRSIKPGSTVRLELKVSGRYGESYQARSILKGTTPAPAPAFEIVNEDDKVVDSVQFPSRTSSSARSWRVPKDLPGGTYTIRPVLDAGPFETVVDAVYRFEVKGPKKKDTFSIYDVF